MSVRIEGRRGQGRRPFFPMRCRCKGRAQGAGSRRRERDREGRREGPRTTVGGATRGLAGGREGVRADSRGQRPEHRLTTWNAAKRSETTHENRPHGRFSTPPRRYISPSRPPACRITARRCQALSRKRRRSTPSCSAPSRTCARFPRTRALKCGGRLTLPKTSPAASCRRKISAGLSGPKSPETGGLGPSPRGSRQNRDNHVREPHAR